MTHLVYRCFDTDDQLIYIGCTSTSVETRLKRHQHSNPDVFERTVRWTAEEHPDLEAARLAEAYAIYDESPLLNVRHNAKRGRGYGASLPMDRPKDFEALRRAVLSLDFGHPPRAG